MNPIEPKLVLISLLIQLGVAAAVSSSLARSTVFRRLLLMHKRSRSQRLQLAAFICAPLMLGVWIRAVVPNFLAADISLATCILLGIIAGPSTATAGAIALAFPAVLHREYLAVPVNVIAAIMGGMFHRFVDVEAVWSFSPMIDLSLYRWVRRNLRRPHLDRQVLLLVCIMLMQLAASAVAEYAPHRYFSLRSNLWLLQLAICAAAPVLVGIPLKIWNAIRIEDKLEQQARLLLEARLDALQRQINPHFLFNTLNSIGSLVRLEPELAREMIVRLANILRILLRTREAFVPFRDELAFTDDYLAIEVVRFGEKLRVVKEIASETLDLVVPSMLLQPLIENSIKHGLEPRISGGTVTLRSRIHGERLLLEVEDDGVGVAPEQDQASNGNGYVRPGAGIGMRNVRERMEVLYGNDALMEMESRPGRGTRITLEMPIVDGSMLADSQRRRS